MGNTACFTKYLADRGLKSTRQRELISATFMAINDHTSAEELYLRVAKEEPDVGLATVYRTLKLLCSAGLAREHRFGNSSSRYEPLSIKQHHDHLICTKCGYVEEFEHPKIEKLQDEIAASLGFEVMTHKLELYGLCRKCQP
ncbi:MAG: transcriptional repressor [Actinobacteria bacterium]|nr:transcriptional repressor [Actinomycetota bacterium]